MNTTNKSFPVLEMTCASCAVSVESMIKSLDGVVSASVNYASESVSVEYQPDVVQPADMQKAVQGVGYDILIESDSDEATTLDEIHDDKFNRLKWRTIWASILSVPVVIIGMFFLDIPYANEIMWALSTPVILWFGKEFYINAWKQARHGSANMDTLVALSTGVAYLFSVFNTLFPEFWQNRGLEAHVYFEAAAVIIAFILLGKLL